MAKSVMASEEVTLDPIVEVTNSVAAMTEGQLIPYIEQSLSNKDQQIFNIGAALSALQASNSWSDQYKTFPEFVLDKFGLQKRSAYYHLNIYDGIVESGLTWDQVSSLGWTKLKILSAVFMKSIGKPSTWVSKAKKMTCSELIEAVRIAVLKAQGGDVAEGEDVAQTVSTLSFKLHPDQKQTIENALTLAKDMTGTEFDSVALDGVCQAFLAGDAQKVAPVEPEKVVTVEADLNVETVGSYLKGLGIQQVHDMLESIWPECEFDIAVPTGLDVL